MKKRYSLKKKIWINIVATLTTIIDLVGIVVNLFALLKIGNFHSFNYPRDITAIVVMSVVAIILISILFFSGYTFGKKKMYYNIGFYVTSVAYDKILLIRQDSEKTMLFIYVKTEKNGMVIDTQNDLQANILQLNVNPKYFDEILAHFKSNNPQSIFEILPTPPTKKEKTK